MARPLPSPASSAATTPRPPRERPSTRAEGPQPAPFRGGRPPALPAVVQAARAKRAGRARQIIDEKPRQSLEKPARAPRLSITLPHDVRAIVDRLATLNRAPAARVIAEVICEAAPVLHKIADAIERVKQVNATKSAAIRATLADAQAEAEKTAATALALLDRIAAPEADAQRPRAEGVPAPAARPRRREPPPSC